MCFFILFFIITFVCLGYKCCDILIGWVAQDLSAMDPGPIDPSVLTSQDTHRSTDVWRGEV